jgi:hypothetical protein
MATARVRWEYEQLHGAESYEQFHDGSFEVWSNRRTKGTPYESSDGVSLWVSTENLSPDDHFLGKPEAIESEQ